MQLPAANQSSQAYRRFNPHPAREPSATPNHAAPHLELHVSILTRPVSRVQRRPLVTWRCSVPVSILTRPVSRVQRHPTGRTSGPYHARFNPHPAREPGATLGLRSWRCRHPVSILTRPVSRVQRGCAGRMTPAISSFNPHPAREPSATPHLFPTDTATLRVSILTRPVSRVQHKSAVDVADTGHGVSILTRPVSRVQHLPSFCPRSGHRLVSILTRPVSRVQLLAAPALNRHRPSFNPHPAREPGATMWRRRIPVPVQRLFQSSPGP